jgi:hypothetical protein
MKLLPTQSRLGQMWLPLVALIPALVCHAQESGTLENSSVAWQWNLTGGQFASRFINKADGEALPIGSECFKLVLGDGRTVNASALSLVGKPRMQILAADPVSPTAASQASGKCLVLDFSDPSDHLTATWTATLRDHANYLQQRLTLRATGGNVWIKEITLFDQTMPQAAVAGSVDGSPVTAGNFFLGYEHPMSQNTVTDGHTVQCRLIRNAMLPDGETLSQSFVIGAAQPGQLRRGFLNYLELAGAHPYRPFLHYNSWFDIAWHKQKYDEKEGLNAINQFGRQLVRKRHVQMDSFLFDDGWDDNKTLWQFHSGFPRGFSPLREAAAKYGANIGVWISPFGGYNVARRERLEYASQFGYETNANGFSLAGPKYYALFKDICLKMIRDYGVNLFKFDGLAAGAKANESGLARDGDAMLRLVSDLRAARPDIYINQTTGTWPSPFWLLWVDSTWRGGADNDFTGSGSWCQQWMTYRDMQTYNNIVTRAPLYPLNALMLHGIIYATNAVHLNAMSDEDFAAQAREFFGEGTQLQELYLTPALLDHQNWDDLAEAAKWSRRNADVLVDTHWVGGDPSQGQVYGWASWNPAKAILVLRNPTGQPAEFSADVRRLFELPPGAAGDFVMHSPWREDHDEPSVILRAGQPGVLVLKPFEVLVLESNATK